MQQLSLAIVGADYPNKRGPGRRFELIQCDPGEPLKLLLEPTNPKDPQAVAVFSARGIQIGYVTAERAPWIGKLLGEREVRAIFQGQARFGGWARVAFDGEEPVLPLASLALSSEPEGADEDSGFWADPAYDE